jgi:hypothetical protein
MMRIFSHVIISMVTRIQLGIKTWHVIHYEKSCLSKPHYLATKTQNKLIYNYYAIIS